MNDADIKFITLVVFESSYENGIGIDSCLTLPWEEERAIWNLMEMTDDERARNNVYQQMSDAAKRNVERATRAANGMDMRARMNGQRLRGPYYLFTEKQPTDGLMIEWATTNVFKKARKS